MNCIQKKPHPSILFPSPTPLSFQSLCGQTNNEASTETGQKEEWIELNLHEEEITFSLQLYNFNFNDFPNRINKELRSEALAGLVLGSWSHKNVPGNKDVSACHSNELFGPSRCQHIMAPNTISEI